MHFSTEQAVWGGRRERRAGLSIRNMDRKSTSRKGEAVSPAGPRREARVYRDASLIRKRTLIGPYNRPMHRALG